MQMRASNAVLVSPKTIPQLEVQYPGQNQRGLVTMVCDRHQLSARYCRKQHALALGPVLRRALLLCHIHSFI